MRKYYLLIFLMFTEMVGVWAFHQPSLADSPLGQNLSISQIKINGDEFLVLKNNTDQSIQLSDYWLQYFNEASLAVTGVSNSSAQLPVATLPARREIMINAGLAPLCGQVLATKLSIGLKDSAGLLQVVAIEQDGQIVGYRPQDQVSWSNAKTGNNADIKLASSPDSKQMWFRASAQGAWQSGLVDYNSACQGGGSSGSGGQPSTVTLGDTAGAPPYVVLGTGNGSGSQSGIPTADAGLASPQISELMPNPAPPQTDANDEFIELYNPNDKPFDLSGFILRSGVATTHDYKFPDGTTMEAKAFESFYISQTRITLSNSEGQASLLDPNGNRLTASDVYSNAKDGQSWILAGGKWQWSLKPSPNSVNIVATPVVKGSTKSSSASKTTAATKAIESGRGVAVAGKSSIIHPLILAVVAAGALLYAGYEYRNDLANILSRSSRNRSIRKGPRPAA